MNELLPLVSDWFTGRYGDPTEPQVHGWPLIRAGRDVLISAPTGSGKTLAAFTTALDGLIRRAAEGPLPDEILVVYVSPLKALTNDVRKNLETPLGELLTLAAERGIDLAPIRTATRTGDTTQSERARMLRKPPHVLVTTPESLYILLTAEKSRALFTHVEAIIVDEIHAMARDKRGSHLALTLARLDDLVTRERRPQTAAHRAFGDGAADRARSRTSSARPPQIVDVGHRREMTLAVEVPSDELGAVASGEMWAEIYDRVAALDPRAPHDAGVRRHAAHERTGRVRARGRGSAKASCLPASRQPLARDPLRHREPAQGTATCARSWRRRRSNSGSTSARSTSSCSSARRARSRSTLQRIGRSGHWVGAKPEGRLFATTRDELIECAALVHAIRGGDDGRALHPERAARHPRAAAGRRVRGRRLGRRRALRDGALGVPVSQPRRAKTSTTCVAMLADGIATSRGRSGAYLHHDRVNGRVRGRRGARIAAITSGGAIPGDGQLQRRRRTRRRRSSERSTKTSPSRAWPATSSCSARRRG